MKMYLHLCQKELKNVSSWSIYINNICQKTEIYFAYEGFMAWD
ncbi:hypothetical protein [Chryseobacterium sp. RLHN22]